MILEVVAGKFISWLKPEEVMRDGCRRCCLINQPDQVSAYRSLN